MGLIGNSSGSRYGVIKQTVAFNLYNEVQNSLELRKTSCHVMIFSHELLLIQQFYIISPPLCVDSLQSEHAEDLGIMKEWESNEGDTVVVEGSRSPGFFLGKFI